MDVLIVTSSTISKALTYGIFQNLSNIYHRPLFLPKQLTVFHHDLFLQKAASQMFDSVLNTSPLYCFYSSLREKFQIRSFFWSLFFCIRTEYRKRTRKSSVFGLFSRSDNFDHVFVSWIFSRRQRKMYPEDFQQLLTGENFKSVRKFIEIEFQLLPGYLKQLYVKESVAFLHVDKWGLKFL